MSGLLSSLKEGGGGPTRIGFRISGPELMTSMGIQQHGNTISRKSKNEGNPKGTPIRVRKLELPHKHKQTKINTKTTSAASQDRKTEEKKTIREEHIGNKRTSE